MFSIHWLNSVSKLLELWVNTALVSFWDSIGTQDNNNPWYIKITTIFDVVHFGIKTKFDYNSITVRTQRQPSDKRPPSATSLKTISVDAKDEINSKLWNFETKHIVRVSEARAEAGRYEQGSDCAGRVGVVVRTSCLCEHFG